MENERNKYLKVIKDVRSLPTIPGIIVKVLSLLDDNETSFRKISRLISSDQTLSARVLRLANSPFYGFPSRVSTIPSAMVMLGANAIKGLVLTSILFEMTEKNALGFWEHGLGSATAANIITKRLNVAKAEEISTAALLHDIGRVIIKAKLGDRYEILLSHASDKKISIMEAETEMLEMDHAAIGGWAARVWELPEALCEPIACHHDVEGSKTHRTETAIVHLADILIKTSGFGFTGDDFVPPIHPAAWNILNLSEPFLEEIAEELGDKLVEVADFSQEVQSAENSH
ncbi:MAG: HDOD domain-containing protein [Nitrospiria bacterium]